MVCFEKGPNFAVYFVCGCFLRWCMSVSDYSGKGRPPMFGDYEAQRHWQEITINTPINQWYYNTSQNDLQFWGLDYPPLTAYHSLLCAYIARFINPDFVELFQSRGYESDSHKFFMRCTVFVSDLLVYMSAVYFLFKKYSAKNSATALLLILINPSVICIDYGHFQYNFVSLGFLLWFVVFINHDSDILASVAFCCALNFKQMELYHALPVFFMLLGKSFQQSFVSCLLKIATLGVTVVASFVIIWFPLVNSLEDAMQILSRLFPLQRGVFEDKVANFWCSVNIFVKVKLLFTESQLVCYSALLTLLFCTPSCILLLRRPQNTSLSIALASCSLSFFMFSYQVHEKSILLFVIPVSLLASKTSLKPVHVVFINLVCSLSMSHLYMKDGNLMSALALTFLITFWALLQCEQMPSMKVSLVYCWSLLVFLLIIALMRFAPTPGALPDLWVVVLCFVSFLHFAVFYLVLLTMVFREFNGDNCDRIKSE